MKTLSLIFSIISLCLFSISAHADCAGYEEVKGFQSSLGDKCLGKVADKAVIPWIMPRRALFVDGETLLVSDMGGWGSTTKGAIWEIKLKDLSAKKIYSGGYFTHGLGVDSEGRILIGDAGQILRMEAGVTTSIIPDLPTEGNHPLTHFIVLPDNSLVVNVGAPSNDCLKEMKANGNSCYSRDREGEVRLYPYNSSTNQYDAVFSRTIPDPDNPGENKTISINYKILGMGLRNSMALAYNPKLDLIYQAENNIDAKNTPEEMNAMPLTSGSVVDFGWPFCYGNGVLAPKIPSAFANFCAGPRTQDPLYLIPNHSAPLDMAYYYGSEHSELNGMLLQTWHGHRRAQEYALIAYDVNKNQAPILDVDADGMNSFIPVLSGLNASNGNKLRPVGMTSDAQGRIWLVDDKTKTLYVFASKIGGGPVDGDGTGFKAKNEAFVNGLENEVIADFAEIFDDFKESFTPTPLLNCKHCHADFPMTDAKQALIFFVNKKWVVPGTRTESTELLARMHKDFDSPRAMPKENAPYASMGTTQEAIYNELSRWVEENISSAAPIEY
ncbi:MAG: hypothetical protein AAF203_06155 [Pseudomonadota bacterium]